MAAESVGSGFLGWPGWLSFSLVLLAILAFSWFYIRYYQSWHKSEMCSTITAILCLSLALMTAALFPVDIFLVSYMKNSTGKYKEWAADNVTRQAVEDSILYGYYSLYSIMLFCIFFWLPFAYFYYEENDDEYDHSSCSRLGGALKYSFGFLFVCAILLLIGAFVPLKNEQKSNATDWEKLAVLVDELGSAYGLDALAFSVSTLTLLGMFCLITYMAYGMSALPAELIKGTKSMRYEQMETSRVAEETEQEILIIKAKCQDGRPLAIRDRCTLERLEGRLYCLHNHQTCQEEASRWACWEKCRCLMRPFQILLGIFLLLMALLIFVTLFMSSLDRAIHSEGFQTGFVLLNSTWSNPINLVLVHLQQVFPLDYIFIAVITIYFIFTSMSGLRNMGIWFLWMKLYKVQPRRTRPQALLLVCLILMLIVLYMSYVLHILAPEYTMFGSQVYLKKDTNNHSDTTVPQQSILPVPCTIEASKDDCTVTRLYLFLHKFWFFTSIYYLGNWLFILVFLIGMTVSCLKRRSSPIEKALEDYDSDEEPLHM